jgi:hypothetical protein
LLVSTIPCTLTVLIRLISPIITFIIRRSQYVDFLLRTAPAASASPSPRRHRSHDNVK